MYDIWEAFKELNKLNDDIENNSNTLTEKSNSVIRSQYEVDHNIYYNKKEMMNDGFTIKKVVPDWVEWGLGHFENTPDCFRNKDLRLYYRTSRYGNINDENIRASLKEYAYEYTEETRSYGHKTKLKKITKDEFYSAISAFDAEKRNKLQKELNDLKANNYNISSITSVRGKDDLLKKLKSFVDAELLSTADFEQIESQIDAELNDKGWCVVLKLTDNYVKSHPGERTRIEKRNLTKKDAYETAHYYSEPVYRMLNAGSAWSYEAMKQVDATAFIKKRNKEEDNIEENNIDNKLNEFVSHAGAISTNSFSTDDENDYVSAYIALCKRNDYNIKNAVNELAEAYNKLYGVYPDPADPEIDDFNVDWALYDTITGVFSDSNDFETILSAIDSDYIAKSFEDNSKSLDYYINRFGDNYEWMLEMYAIYHMQEPGRYTIDISNRQDDSGVKGSIIIKKDGTYTDIDLEYV